METLIAVVFLAVGAGCFALYFKREADFRNPSKRWPALAESLGLKFADKPPRIVGQWKGRAWELKAVDGRAELVTPVPPGRVGRVEVGPRAALEKAAGLVVHDKLSFSSMADEAFEARFLVRSTPPEAGQLLLDANLRKRLLAFGEVYILAQAGKAVLELDSPTDGERIREAMDLLTGFAESVDRT